MAPVTPVPNQGVSVDIEEWECTLNKLDWTKSTEVRLYFLRRLRSFDICWTMLRMCLWVCGGQCQQTQQTDPQGQWLCWGVELDSLAAISERRMLSKLSGQLGQCLPPTRWCAGQTQECIQCKTHSSEMHHRAPQEVIPACGHQAFHLLPQSVRHSESIDWPYFTPVSSFINPSFIYNSYFRLCNNFVQ